MKSICGEERPTPATHYLEKHKMIETLKQAVYALEFHTRMTRPLAHTDDAIASLKQLIAQLEKQEPVAWISSDGDCCKRVHLLKPEPSHWAWKYNCQPLYTNPAPAVPDGWKLVPIEPTIDMREIMQSVLSATFPQTRNIYKAMLSVAPEYKGQEK